MLIETRTRGFSLTESILLHVQKRLEAALGVFSPRLVKVTVRLEDVNADHGGVDKRCSVSTALRRGGVTVADALNSDLYATIDKAASRARRTVARALKRHQIRERRDIQRPGALIEF